MEDGADYDGLAVQWGIGNKKATAADCEAACRKCVAFLTALTCHASHMPDRLPSLCLFVRTAIVLSRILWLASKFY
eukprot:2824000-Pyramimonas_sp.AAC.1